MDKSQIAVELEAVQDRCDTTGQIVETLAALKKWGYETVEILHRLNPDDGSTWRELLDAQGMKACATHELLEDLLADPDLYVRKAQDLGCTLVAAALAKSVVWEDPASVKKLIGDLNRLGEYFYRAGLELMYHNHNMEFAKLTPDKNCLRYIFEETDPCYVTAELDTYWIQLSGMSPKKWCTSLNGRLRAVHLKDLCVTGGTYDKYIKTPAPAALGAGNMDIRGVVRAADAAGCRWFIVETHTNWVDGDSVKTAGLSYQYLLNRAL